MKRTVTKWNLDEKVRLRSKVREVIWNEDSAKWKVKVDTETGLIEDEAEILVNGSGILKLVLRVERDPVHLQLLMIPTANGRGPRFPD